MRDPPLAIYFAIANGRAHPDIGFLAACPLPTDPVEAVAEGHIIARVDAY